MSQIVIRHSDHRIRELVESALARNPYLTGRRINVQVRDENVVLSGVVGTYYQKQVAQEAIRPLVGASGIRNELEVLPGGGFAAMRDKE